MPITSLSFSPDGRLIALSAIDGGTEIRDARNANSSNAFPRMASRARLRSLRTGACLRWGVRGDGQLYSTETWAPLGRRLEGHTQRITNVEFSRDGRTLATSSADGTVLLWDVETQEPIGSSLVVSRHVRLHGAEPRRNAPLRRFHRSQASACQPIRRHGGATLASSLGES